MREAALDLWSLHAAGWAVAVTTNGLVPRSGRAAQLGRGCARQAGERFPWLATALGASLIARGNHVAHLGQRIASFPVEHDPFALPDPALIARSARELAALADAEAWTHVALPRPGCGGGGMSWAEVQPLLLPALDDRFLVVTRGPGLQAGRAPGHET